MRVAIVGLYCSGASYWAGCLHRLGVDMGSPFWENDDENSPTNHFEPRDLSETLRLMWNAPKLKKLWPAERRIEALTNWIVGREHRSRTVCGANHPLISLSADELSQAWGDDTVLFWAHRRLEDSISGILRSELRWERRDKICLQYELWERLVAQPDRGRSLLKLPYDSIGVPSETRLVLQKIIEHLGLSPNDLQLAAAGKT